MCLMDTVKFKWSDTKHLHLTWFWEPSYVLSMIMSLGKRCALQIRLWLSTSTECTHSRYSINTCWTINLAAKLFIPSGPRQTGATQAVLSDPNWLLAFVHLSRNCPSSRFTKIKYLIFPEDFSTFKKNLLHSSFHSLWEVLNELGT